MFDELFAKDGFFKLHDRNLQLNGFFGIIECPYLLKNEVRFTSRNIRNIRYRTETAAFVVPGYGTICSVT